MTVFISKNENELGDLPAFLASAGIALQCSSLLRFEALDFDLESTAEVVFFPSIRAAQFLIDSGKMDLRKHTLACSGKQTAERIGELGFNCEFVGKNAGEPLEVAREFSEWLGSRNVLVPHSDRSALSIRTYIPEEQFSAVLVYRTVLSEIGIAPCDVYAFSSPSNIEAFFSCNELKAGSRVIVWGQASLKALEACGQKADHVLREGTLRELKEVLGGMH